MSSHLIELSRLEQARLENQRQFGLVSGFGSLWVKMLEMARLIQKHFPQTGGLLIQLGLQSLRAQSRAWKST